MGLSPNVVRVLLIWKYVTMFVGYKVVSWVHNKGLQVKSQVTLTLWHSQHDA